MRRSITSLQDLILSDILRSTPSLPVCSLAAVRRCVIYLSFVGTYFSHSHGTYLQPNHGDCEPNWSENLLLSYHLHYYYFHFSFQLVKCVQICSLKGSFLSETIHHVHVWQKKFYWYCSFAVRYWEGEQFQAGGWEIPILWPCKARSVHPAGGWRTHRSSCHPWTPEHLDLLLVSVWHLPWSEASIQAEVETEHVDPQ